jgi:hypothetical protein
VKGSAGGPNGSSGAPDGRSGREPESASFEIARVPARRGSPPIFILGFLATVGAIVAVGAGLGSPSQPASRPVAIDASPSRTSAPTEAPSPSSSAPAFLSDATFAAGELFDSGPGLIQLKAQRLPASVSVHGDVFVAHVTWVFVSLHDETGRVVGWTSVSVPGAVGPARGTGPTLRFDVQLTVPDGSAGGLWLDANAYDASGASGAMAASVRLDVSSAATGSRFFP